MKVRCPKCGASLKVPNDATEGRVRCPSCRHTFRLGRREPSHPSPGPSTPSASPTPPSESRLNDTPSSDLGDLAAAATETTGSTTVSLRDANACRSCGGSGKVPCPCNGTGKMTCPACSGTGQEPCPLCKGEGLEICGRCQGAGYALGADPVRDRCISCAGKGKITCRRCQGKGTMGATCARCGGTGIIACSCGGTGVKTCAQCHGTGKYPYRADTVLALGILGFVFPPLGPIAWVMGSKDLKAMAAGTMDTYGLPKTRSGKICGMVSTCCYGGLILLAILLHLVGSPEARPPEASQRILEPKAMRGFLGVVPLDVDKKLARLFRFPARKGALVMGVLPDSPADKAGLREEDLVLAVGSRQIADASEFWSAAAALRPGDVAPVLILRKGTEITVNVLVAPRPRDMKSAGIHLRAASKRARGSPEELHRILEDHVRGLSIAAKQSTSLRRQQLAEQTVAITACRLERHAFSIVASVEDVSPEPGSLSGEGNAYIRIARRARVGQRDQTGFSLYFAYRTGLTVKMNRARAGKIDKGDKLVLRGIVLVRSQYVRYTSGDGLPRLEFSYKEGRFYLAPHAWRIVNE